MSKPVSLAAAVRALVPPGVQVAAAIPVVGSGPSAWEVLGEPFFPELTVEMFEYVLWNMTGFPSFFDGDPGETLLLQLAEVRAMLDSGMSFKAVCEEYDRRQFAVAG